MNVQVLEAVDLEKLISDAEQLVERRSAEALPFAEQAMQLALESKNERYIAYAKYILAFYNCLVLNDYEKAINLCYDGLDHLIDEAANHETAYKIYMTLGNSYQLRGEVFSAQDSYMKGLRQLESRKTLNARESGFLASFYYNVSLLLSSSELNISSEDYLTKAIEIYKSIDSGFKLSKCYVAFAGIYEKKGDYQKAIEILYKALEIDERINDAYSIALSKANLGILYLRIENHTAALDYLKPALDFFSAGKMLYETGMVKVSFGEVLFSTGKKNEGLQQLLEAEDIFNKLENKHELTGVYQLLAKFMAESCQHKTAFEYQVKYTDNLRYFFDSEKTNALTRAKREFESDLKEKEAELLKQKNEAIKTYADKLEVSNNELKQFAHVASHDLREPLRMVNAYMGLLKKSLNGNLSPQQNDFIGFAIDGAKRMEQLILDLLRLAKVDANPHVEDISLNHIIADIQMNLDALVKERGAEIIAINMPVIRADRTQMMQLFQNIIGNGIKYNKHAQPVVSVKCVHKRDVLEISIADNGIGIPAEHRDRVFQIFQRLQSAKEFSGSGIGLAICKKIVESMGGKINIGDNPEGGTVFNITLPDSILALQAN